MRVIVLSLVALLLSGAASAQTPPPPPDFPGLEAIDERRNWTAPGESPTFGVTEHIKLDGVAKLCSETLAAAQWRQDVLLQFEAKAHFDNCAFNEALDYVTALIREIDALDLGKHPDRATTAADRAGRTLHAIQDFYAHSNYVDLMAKNGGAFDKEKLVLPIWTSDGRAEVRKLAGRDLVSGRVWWNGPKQCSSNVPTHGQMAKDSDELPGGKKRLEPWKRSAYRAAIEIADQATRNFLRFAYERWPALQAQCGPIVVYLPASDRRPDPPENQAATTTSALPRCRLDDRMIPIATKTLEHVLDASRHLGHAVPDRIAVNPEVPEPGALSLQLVGDLPVGMAGADGCPIKDSKPASPLTLDAYSVRGLCEAVSSSPALIRCSGGEVREIAGKDQWESRPNAALAYIFAHELSHLLHKDRSHFQAASRVIDLSKPAPDKRRLLYQLCEGSDASRAADRKQEERADDEALAIVRDVVQRSPYRDVRIDADAAVSQNAMSLERAAGAAHRWLMSIGEDAPFPRRLLDAETPADEATAREIARGLLCDIDGATSGRTTLPVVPNGSHPPEPDRLSRAYESFSALGHGVPAVEGTAARQAEQMIAALAPIQAKIYADTAKLYADVGRCLCEQVDQDRTVLCKGVTLIHPNQQLEPQGR
jgi:hypothetical protein